jgi:hypothetical protein
MYNNLKKYSKFLLMSKNLIDDKQSSVINYYAKVINMIIYNIVSLTSILTILLFDSTKVTSNTIIVTKKYLNDMCKINKKIKGGTVLPAEFFGADSGRYSANVGNDLLKVDFENLEARPTINSTMESTMTGGGMGGCNLCKKFKGGELGFNKQLLVIVSKIFKEHKIKIDKILKQDLVNLIKTYLYFLIHKLHNSKKKINLIIMKKIIKKSGCYKLTI